MHARIIEQALRAMQAELRANQAFTDGKSIHSTVQRLRAIIAQRQVRAAFERAGDSRLLFILRGIKQILSDRLASDEKTRCRLGPILDHPDLDRALNAVETPAKKSSV